MNQCIEFFFFTKDFSSKDSEVPAISSSNFCCSASFHRDELVLIFVTFIQVWNLLKTWKQLHCQLRSTIM